MYLLACDHWASGPELTAAAFPEGSLQRAVYQSIPSTWDETIVLPASKPGSIAAFARRKGKDWFVGIINGNENEAVTLDNVSLPFLGAKKYNCVSVADGSKPDEFQTGRSSGVSTTNPLTVKMHPGGGFVAMLRPE